MSRALTDASVKRLAPKPKLYRKADGTGIGLVIEVVPSGARHWRLRYTAPNGKPRMIALGSHPEVDVEAARKLAQAARDQLKTGADPALEKRRQALRASVTANDTFGGIAQEYLASRPRWSERHAAARRRCVENDLSDLARLPITQIDAPMVLACLRKLEQRGVLEKAAKARQLASQVFRYAQATGRATTDPAKPLSLVMQTRPSVGRLAIPLDDLPTMFEAIAQSPAEAITRRAFVFMYATAGRTGEVRGAAWREVEQSGKRWIIPAARMKMQRDHLVPLSTLAIAAMGERGEDDDLLFPGYSRHGGQLSENTLNTVLVRAGYFGRQHAHGCRAHFKTWASEVDKSMPPEAVEMCLSHPVPGISGTYNRAQYVTQRTAILQRWADYLTSAGIRKLL